MVTFHRSQKANGWQIQSELKKRKVNQGFRIQQNSLSIMKEKLRYSYINNPGEHTTRRSVIQEIAKGGLQPEMKGQCMVT